MEIQLEGDWNTRCLRCPACGSRDRFWTLASVTLNALGGPTVLLAPDYGGRLECGACAHSGTFRSFEPPWRAPTRRAVSAAGQHAVRDEPAVRPLTVTDHVDQAAWLAGGPEWVA